MAQRNIGSNWNRDNRNNINENFTELYKKYQDYFTKITEDLREDLIEGSHIEIKGYFETEESLPSSASNGDTYFITSTGVWERWNGNSWDSVAKTDPSEFIALKNDFDQLEVNTNDAISQINTDFSVFKQEVNNTIDTQIGDIEASVQQFIDQIEGQIVYVEDEGSNNNGNYVKYSDGTLICWGKKRYEGGNQLDKDATGSIFRTNSIEWDFPVSFIDDNVTVSTDVNSAVSWSGLSSEPSNTGFYMRVFSSLSPAYNLVINMQAVGRWK